ncbi:MAG: cell envelope integrity EipB family protein [Pseudorhodoplanes sp.]|nr:cell envelope integrity EipB family protein [Pseudorhodoplanes sp.]
MPCFRSLTGGSRALSFAALALLLGSGVSYAQIAKQPNPARGERIELAPHRAVYDLKLKLTRGKRPVEAVRGRILYDFSGNACEGYALQFRHVSELRIGESGNLFTDLRAATWEDGKAKSFRFNSQNYMNQRLVDSVDGRAERRAAGLNVKLSKPSGKTVTLDGALIFPTEHMRQIIAAARADQTILSVPIFDGSETGEKIYNTLAVIGKAIAPGTAPTDDAAGKDAGLAALTRWPVHISYFDKARESGEQTPVYAISFELYENGVSRALSLDYNDFVISAEMTSLEFKKRTACR